jgi:hypothetical protein
MFNSYSSLCDAFYLDMYLNTHLDLPCQRDTVLTFFERIQRQFPAMGNLTRRDNGDFVLTENRGNDRFRSLTLEVDRLCSTCADPADLNEAYDLHRLALELSPYMLGVSSLDIVTLDVTYTMDFDFKGNHNDVLAEAFFASSPFSSILELDGTKAIGFSPSSVIALSDDCRTQARIAVEGRTDVNEIRNEKFDSEEPISVYFTIRQYPRPDEKFDAVESFKNQCVKAEELMAEKIIPGFVQPLANAIAHRR